MGTVMRIAGMAKKRKFCCGVSLPAFFRAPPIPRPPIPPKPPLPKMLQVPEKLGHYYRERDMGKEVEEKMQASTIPSEEKGRPPLLEIPEGGFLPLWDLRDNPHKKKKRVGRGIGSGSGKTCGRGQKGQKSRSGHKPKLGFEGGQIPFRVKMPRKGIANPFALFFKKVSLQSIKEAIEAGKIDPNKLITMKTLKDSGLYGKRYYDGVDLIGRSGTFERPLHIEVSRVSVAAKEAIENAGGTVRKVHYNKLGLKALCDPDWFTKKKRRILPLPARPKPKIVKLVDATGRLPAPESPILPEGFVLRAPVYGYPPPGSKPHE